MIGHACAGTPGTDPTGRQDTAGLGLGAVDGSGVSAAIVVGAPQRPWAAFGLEMLDHLRLEYRLADSDIFDAAAAHRIAILLEPAIIPPGDRPSLLAWVRNGGVLVCCGGAGDVGAIIGMTDGDELPDGHVRIDGAVEWGLRFDVPLHAFGGRRLLATGPSVTDSNASGRPDGEGDDDAGCSPLQVLAHWQDGSIAAVRREFGAGQIVVLGADPWQSIGRIQQGWPVTAPGCAAPDGSAAVGADGVLRCDDGLALSFTTDRAMPDGSEATGPYPASFPPDGPVPAFHRPQADLWRELMTYLLLDGARATGVPLAVLHYWPAGVPAVGHLSHDSDNNRDEEARFGLSIFAAAAVRVTWCHCWPGGYAADVMSAIGQAGHEHALHYNAMPQLDGMPWGPDGFAEQYRWATETTGTPIVSNKNHYTRWEGWTEFYDWCVRAGIQIDETRGPSKPGTVGFPYGSSHVGFPVNPQGERVDVLALPLHTQDVGWQSDESVIDLIIDQAHRHHGVAHFLFHSGHLLHRPRTARAVGAVVATAGRHGMPWWTAGQINQFERARRGVSIHVGPIDHGLTDGTATSSLSVRSHSTIPNAGILLALPDDAAWRATGPDGTPLPVTRVPWHGREMIQLTVDINPGITQISLRKDNP